MGDADDDRLVRPTEARELSLADGTLTRGRGVLAKPAGHYVQVPQLNPSSILEVINASPDALNHSLEENLNLTRRNGVVLDWRPASLGGKILASGEAVWTDEETWFRSTCGAPEDIWALATLPPERVVAITLNRWPHQGYTDGTSLLFETLGQFSELRQLKLDNVLGDLYGLGHLDGLGQLAGLRKLRSLQLSSDLNGNPSTSVNAHHREAAESLDLAGISDLPALTVLCLEARNYSTLGLRPLSATTALEFLSIRAYSVSLDLSPLSTLPRLLSLTVSGDSIDPLPFSGFGHLRSLSLSAGTLASSDTTLTGESAFPRLQYLHLHTNVITSMSLRPFGDGAALEELSILAQTCSFDGLAFLARLPSLRRFTLVTQASPPDLFPLTTCIRIEKLILAPRGDGAIDIAPLAQLSSLCHLEISLSKEFAVDLSPLARIPSLRILEIVCHDQDKWVAWFKDKLPKCSTCVGWGG